MQLVLDQPCLNAAAKAEWLQATTQQASEQKHVAYKLKACRQSGPTPATTHVELATFPRTPATCFPRVFVWCSALPT